jgi:tripartite-type tricarboxylate transporter receptor subunit TctC
MLLTTIFWANDFAYSQSSFYKGKTLLIIQGRRPGGLGDIRTRAAMTRLSKFIPGNPTIVTQYMPGAGGRKAANHLYQKARRDGLTLANIGSGFVSNGITGAAGVNYDVDKFVFLGSGNSNTTYVFATRSAAGFDNIEKLRSGSVRIGTLSVGHEIYTLARMFSWIIGLKDVRFVPGYSGPELDLAVTRGEVDGRVNNPATMMRRSPEWILKNKTNLHSVLEIPKGFRLTPHPAFKKPPTLESFTKTDQERKILVMQRNFRLVGSPYIAPPGVPKDRLEILRQAFRKVFKDPETAKVWVKLTGEEYHPLLPEEQAEAVRSIPRSSEMLGLYKQIAGAGPLPPR